MFSSARIGWPAATLADEREGRGARGCARSPRTVPTAPADIAAHAIEQLDGARLRRIAPEQAEALEVREVGVHRG